MTHAPPSSPPSTATTTRLSPHRPPSISCTARSFVISSLYLFRHPGAEDANRSADLSAEENTETEGPAEPRMRSTTAAPSLSAPEPNRPGTSPSTFSFILRMRSSVCAAAVFTISSSDCDTAALSSSSSSSHISSFSASPSHSRVSAPPMPLPHAPSCRQTPLPLIMSTISTLSSL